MSRRLRLEEERAKQLSSELQEEEDKIKLQQQRIFGPIIWTRLECGIKIQDLQANYYEQVLDFILQYFVEEDVIFRNTRTKLVDDPDSVKSFRQKLLLALKDRTSIIALNEVNDEIVGVLLLKAMKKADFGRVFSRCQLTDGGRVYQSILEFLNYINRKADVFDFFNCDAFLRYYILCIHPEYRRKNLGLRLMQTGIDIARHLNLPVIMGVFPCWKLQMLARKLGMQTLFELNYVKWVDKADELVFCEPGAGNYTCALMAGEVPPLVLIKSIQKLDESESKLKLTRAEKRKAKTKQK